MNHQELVYDYQYLINLIFGCFCNQIKINMLHRKIKLTGKEKAPTALPRIKMRGIREGFWRHYSYLKQVFFLRLKFLFS